MDELGLEASDKHCLELLDIVSDLMQVPEGHVELDWRRIYITYMSECSGVAVDYTSSVMRPFAENCYEDLCEVLKAKY